MELIACLENKHRCTILKSISRKVIEFSLQEIMMFPTKYSGIIQINIKSEFI